MKIKRKVPNYVSKEEKYTGAEIVSKNKKDSSSRLVGTDSLTNIYKEETPGERRERIINLIKHVVHENLQETKVRSDSK